MSIVSNGEISEFNQKYDFGCMFDLLGNLSDSMNYYVGSYNISVPKIKYNTSYKCRLNKN